MEDQLRTLHAAIGMQTESIEDTFSTTPKESLAVRPSEKSWSVLEHVEHLSIVNELYLTRIGSAIESARAAGRLARGPYHGGWLAEKLIASQEPPPKMRLRTFKKAKPMARLDAEQVLDRFRTVQGDCLALLVAGDGVDLTAAKLRSPLFELLKLSAIQGFRLIKAHNDRHIWHIERATSS